MNSIALRVQQLSLRDQVAALGRIAQTRTDAGRFSPAELDRLFDDLGLPRPAKVANVLLRLELEGAVARLRGVRGSWRLTPVGLARVADLVTDLDLAALMAEAKAGNGSYLGHTIHPIIPPSLAPPEIVQAMRAFLSEHPFDLNVFGMTRFPDEQDETDADPVAGALETARAACAAHGLEFHLASDRTIAEDLWANVAAHMWASRYGIGFFEDRRGRGLNYNLTLEVGGMLVTGRRSALLKDTSIDRMPTDLVGKIYIAVDLGNTDNVASAIHSWIANDLSLGACSSCLT